MLNKKLLVLFCAVLVGLLAAPRGGAVLPPLLAQGNQAQGKSIGSITTRDNLVVFELNEGALGRANMFDLEQRTLRFTPGPGGYRVENVALDWDAEPGTALTAPRVALKNFAFPFSGKSWDGFSVGTTGSIAFDSASGAGAGAGGGGRGIGGPGGGGGVTIGRFDQLQDAAKTLVNGQQPAICVFMKPRMSGTRFVKELPDRVVVTWSLTEPVGGIQDFTWTPTTNRFQAVLFKDGTIQMSYERLAARDAIIGVYPQVNAGLQKPIGTMKDGSDSAVAPHLDATSVQLSAIDGLYLRATFSLRGPALPEGDANLAGLTYQIALKKGRMAPAAAASALVPADVTWTIRGVAAGGRGGRGGGGGAPAGSRYVASGDGAQTAVTIKGNTIAMQGTLPAGFKAGDEITIAAETSAATGTAADTIVGQTVKLAGIASPAQDLSAVVKQDGPFATVFESFHYLRLPSARDLTCTVLTALGDQFDFLAFYSDFRIDNQEAGTPSTGPLGGGPDGGAVTGIGANQRSLGAYCTQGRFQWQFIQPVYAGSNQAQRLPPDGLTDTNTHNIVTYAKQIGARTPDGKLVPYSYGVSQIAHEMGHRWSAFVSAKVGNETIPLGPTHWARGLHAPVPFPFQRPTEASAMGGGVWQDNFDGTFTQLDDDYYVPATGWSYLDLYLMGLITAAEVPDFFILRNLAQAGRDAAGRPIFKAERTKITIQDVIAAEGPRLPAVDRAQKKFNTGIVVMVERGKTPSKELIERASGIRDAWIDYFAITTGHRASMTAVINK